MATGRKRGRPRTDSTTQISFRIPKAWVERAERIAAAKSAEGSGERASTSSVYRVALGRGLDALEPSDPGDLAKLTDDDLRRLQFLLTRTASAERTIKRLLKRGKTASK